MGKRTEEEQTYELPDEDHRLPLKGIFRPVKDEVFAWICINGEPARVYGIQQGLKKYDDDRAMKGYIEVKEGDEFQVKFCDRRLLSKRDKGLKRDYNAVLFVDGKEANGTTFPSKWVCLRKNRNSAGRIQTYGDDERAFKFVKLNTTSNEDEVTGIGEFLGQISMGYWWVTLTKQKRTRRKRSPSTSDDEIEGGDEDENKEDMAKKIVFFDDEKKPGVSVQVALGASIDKSFRRGADYDGEIDMTRPDAEARFYYVSRASPTPSPKPAQRASPEPTPVPPPANDEHRVDLTLSFSSGSEGDDLEELEEELEHVERLLALRKKIREKKAKKAGRVQMKGANRSAGVADEDEEKPPVKKVKKEEPNQGKGKGKQKEVLDLTMEDD
ncbi:hypothetical protein JCM11251_006540 [Rhodosporidiobolus azoricus]